MAKAGKLKHQHHAFIDAMLSGLNATQAYLKAYPHVDHRTAKSNGSRLAGQAHVAEELQRRRAEVSQKVGVKLEEILGALRNIAMADIRKMYDGKGKPLPLDQLPEDLACALSSLEAGGAGIRVKTGDRVKALTAMAQLSGLRRPEKLEVSGPGGGAITVELVSFADTQKETQEED